MTKQLTDYQRTPFGYDGQDRSSKHLGDLLTAQLGAIHSRYAKGPHRICEIWPQVVGPKIASMSTAVKFVHNVLHVNVKNSTLLSLLSAKEDKQRILNIIRKQLPGLAVHDIVFRIG